MAAMRFRVVTDERVKGVYEVEAESEEALRQTFAGNGPFIEEDWQHMTQISYMAYLVELEEVAECP